MSEVSTASYVILWIVVAVQGFLLLGALRHIGLLQLRVGSDPGALITNEGLPRGALAPDAEGVDVFTGQIRRLSDYAGRRLALVFLSPTCQSCKQLVPHLNAVYADRRQEVEFLVVCNGTKRDCSEFARLFKVAPATVADYERHIAARLETGSTPFAFLLDPDRRVLIRGVVNDWMQLDALLEEQGTLGLDLSAASPGRMGASPGETPDTPSAAMEAFR